MRTIQKKICLLGGFAVGKTSLTRRFVEGRFDEKYLVTIGVTISRKPVTRDDHILNMLIWDLAGGDNFSEPASSYLRGAAGALIVCDLTRSDTLGFLDYYANQLQEIAPNAAIVFIGNKLDLKEERAIKKNEISKIGRQYEAPVLLTSAKTGANVDAAFVTLAEHLEDN